MTYGLIGVGAIADAIVTGLCDGVADAPPILLSPRNAATASALAERYETVTVEADNQTVVDGASVVLLCVRPQVAVEVLGELRFPADRTVVSAVAAVGIEQLRPLVAPATDVARVIPLPSVARRQGITPVHPPNAAAQALFERCGEAAAVDDVHAFDAFSAATATAAAHYAQLGAIGAWLEAHGVPEAEATRYVASMYIEIGEQLRAGRPFEELAREHTTAGGLNEQFRAGFEQAGVYDEVRRGLDAVLRRVAGS